MRNHKQSTIHDTCKAGWEILRSDGSIMNRWGCLGAVLLVVGGLLEGGAVAVGSVTSPPASTPLGASLLFAYAAGLVCVGVGLIGWAVSIAGSGRIALTVAGMFALIAPVVDAVQHAAGGGLGAGPSQAVGLLLVAAILVAALRLPSNPRVHGAARWCLAVPATCFVISFVLYVPAIAALPWFGITAAGALLLGPRRQSSRYDGETWSTAKDAAPTQIAVADQRTLITLKVLLAAEGFALIIALLVVHYGGIPFSLGDQQSAWCIDHGGLPAGAESETVWVGHTLWPLGITCNYGATSVAYPDWSATYWAYALVAAVLATAAVTLVLLVRAQRRAGHQTA